MTTLQDCLDVLTDVIQSQHLGGAASSSSSKDYQPTPTEYFQVITNVITSGGNLGDKLQIMLRVYEAVIAECTPSIVAAQFQVVIKTLMAIAKGNAEDSATLSITLSCIGEILRKQETSEGFWSNLFTLQALNGLLAFLDDQNPKVRKASQETIIKLLTHHHSLRAVTLRAYFTDFAVGVMKATTRNNYHRSHCLVVLLESCLFTIPEKSILTVLEQLLKLQVCEIPKLTAAIFRTFDAFFQHPKYSYTVECSYHILCLLLSNLPQTSDIEATGFYLNAISSDFLLVLKNSAVNNDGSRIEQFVLNGLDKLCSICYQYCDSEFTQVHCSVAINLKRVSHGWLQYSCYAETISQWSREYQLKYEFQSLAQLAKSNHSIHIPISILGMCSIVSIYEKVLSLKHQYAWTFLLESLRSLLDQFYNKPEASYLFKTIIIKLADLYQSIELGTYPLEPAQTHAIQETVGKILQTIGLIPFVQLVPMFEMKETSIHTKDWVIELLQKELKTMKCKISDFVFCILPIAGKIHKLIVHFQSKTGREFEAQIRLLRNKIVQLWSLLPVMCHGAVLDIDASIVKVIPIFQQTMQEESDYPEIKLAIVYSLKNIADSILVYHSYDEGKEAQLRKLFQQQISGLLLPMLLQYIDSFPSYSDLNCREVIQCIHQWMRLSSDSLIQNVAKRLLQLVLVTTAAVTQSEESDAMDQVGGLSETQEKAAIWMAILLAIVPVLSSNLLQIVYKTIYPLLSPNESQLIQKRAYNVLHALITHHFSILFPNDAAFQELLTFLQQSVLVSQVSARNSRLYCIEVLLEKLSENLGILAEGEFSVLQAFEILSNEIFHCLKDSNTKTRVHITNILKIFSHCIDKVDFFRAMYALLLQQTEERQTTMRSAIIQSLSIHLLEQFQRYMDYMQDRILEGEDDSAVDSEEEDANDDDDDDDDSDEADNYNKEEDEENIEENEALPKTLKEVMRQKKHLHNDGEIIITTDHDQLLQNYSQLVNVALETIPTVCSLLSQESTEQIKSILVYIKIVIIMSDKKQLEPHLSFIFPAITKQIPFSLKSKFLNKIRAIFRKLLKKFPSSPSYELETGELLRPFIPSSDMALLDYIIKENRKSKKKKLLRKQLYQQQQLQQQNAQQSGNRTMYDRMAQSDDDDDDDEEDYEVLEEGKPRSSVFNKSIKGKSVKGKTITRAGSVISKRTKMTRGSVMSRYEEYHEDDDEEGERETDYRFQSTRKVKGLRAKEYSARSNRKRSFAFDDEDYRAHDDAADDSDIPDEDDDNDNENAAEVVAQNNAFNRKRMRPNNQDNPFQASPNPPPATSTQKPNKRQRMAVTADTSAASALPSLLSFSPSLNAAAGSGKDDEKYQVVITKDGKVKIQEKSLTEQMLSAAPTSLDQLTNKKLSRKGGSVRSVDHNKVSGGQSQSERTKGREGRKKSLRLKEPGIEYRAKKAGGDIWKKGQTVQPHAFIPLDPRLFTKKHHAEAVEHFGVVVNHQKKMKNKLKNKNARK